MQQHKRLLAAVFASSFFFSIHLALVSYVNSSMLSRVINPGLVSVLFAIGSTLSIILILCAPRMLKEMGVVRFNLGLFLFSALLCFILGTAHVSTTIMVAFVAYFALNACILYSIDIFIEHYSADRATGNIRGLALTVNNLGWVGMPVLVGFLSMRYGFSAVYLLAAIALCVAGTIIAISQRNFTDRSYAAPNLVLAFSTVRKTPALRRIMSINFFLQFFYSWMVLYVPVYLSQTLHLPWSTIGGILSVMLIPFVLLQYPAGRIADTFLGEKELIIAALVIMGISTSAFALMNMPTVAMLAAALFCTRIGASVLEVMCDSYFFKQVTDADTGVISLYRTMAPFAYVIGPMTGALLLTGLPHITLFLVLGVLAIVTAFYAFRLRDTN